MFKKFMGAVYLLAASSLVFAEGIIKMTGDASLVEERNWDPELEDKVTVVVGGDNFTLTMNYDIEIQAIRLGSNSLRIRLENLVLSTHKIGSIAGAGKGAASMEFKGGKLNLTGNSGAGNIPGANDYSGLSRIALLGNTTINVAAKTSLGCKFALPQNPGEYSTINIENDVVITDTSIASVGDNRFTIAEGKSLTLSGENMNLTSAFDFKESGILTLSGKNTVFNPRAVSNARQAVLNINNNITTSKQNVLSIPTINIADNQSFAIDTADVALYLSNRKPYINFGENSVLIFTNSSQAVRGKIILRSDLEPSREKDDYGTVKIRAITNELTIGHEGGPYKIGMDNTHRLQNFIVEGSGGIVVDNTVFAKLISMNSAGEVRFNQTLDLGESGRITFGENGTLVAEKGVNGSIKTSTDNTGTITIGDGNVGAVGDQDKKLKQVNFNQGSAASIGKLYASNVSVGGVGPITASDLLTSDVLFSSNGTLVASKGIVGYVDFAGKDGLLRLAYSQTIDGSVDSSTASAGTLEFLGKGTITGSIGATNALNSLKFSGVGDITIPHAQAVTINIANTEANVTSPYLLTSDVLFSSDGTLVAKKGVNGSIKTSIDNTGTLTIGGGNVGAVGDQDKKLKQVNFNQGSAASIGKLYASNVSVGGVGPITASDLLTSDVLFSSDGTLVAKKGVNGSIKTSIDNTGTLTIGGGNVGAVGDQDKKLKQVNFNQGSAASIGKLYASNVSVGGVGPITASDLLTSDVLFSSDGTLVAKKGVNGSIKTSIDNTGTLTIGGGNVGAVGDQDKKLKQVNFNQTQDGSVILHNNISASTINIDNANIEVSDNILMQGNISAGNSSIFLNNNTMTLSGTHIFSDQIKISSTYDESSLAGGNIVLASGSTLDLSNVSILTVKLLFTNSDISKITDDTKYNIILAGDGSSIVPLHDPESRIILDSSGEQNKFVKWKLDANSFTLYAYDDSNNVIDTEYVFDSEQNNIFMQQLKSVLPNSSALEFKNNIGLLSKEQVEEILSRILDHSKERGGAMTQVALFQALADTNKDAISAIHNRLLNIGTNPIIVSAGDDDMDRYEDSADSYGVWARFSINHSRDKVSGKNSEYFSSYKTKGFSSTIGGDSLICDNILLGAAYTNAHTTIKPQNQNIGNIDKVRTHMFSLYSAYNIPNYNWYVASTISYAESSIRGSKIRKLATARNVLNSEIASSKYKSYLYSGSVSLGYNHYLGSNTYVMPSLGAVGSLIREKGCTETGTSFQNLTVRKKNYNKLSGTTGLRVYQNIYLDNTGSVIVTPQVYGFVNYNIKNKTPAIDARLDGIDERLPTINHKSNRVNYNLGLGVMIKQNMMEYSINYDANLAKKYQGYTGSIKVRVNF